jgi:hypothetical protein
MKKIKYIVRLSEEEQAQLEAIVHKGKCAARKQTRARILLKAAADVPTKDIVRALVGCVRRNGVSRTPAFR